MNVLLEFINNENQFCEIIQTNVNPIVIFEIYGYLEKEFNWSFWNIIYFVEHTHESGLPTSILELCSQV